MERPTFVERPLGTGPVGARHDGRRGPGRRRRGACAARRRCGAEVALRVAEVHGICGTRCRPAAACGAGGCRSAATAVRRTARPRSLEVRRTLAVAGGAPHLRECGPARGHDRDRRRAGGRSAARRRTAPARLAGRGADAGRTPVAGAIDGMVEDRPRAWRMRSSRSRPLHSRRPAGPPTPPRAIRAGSTPSTCASTGSPAPTTRDSSCATQVPVAATTASSAAMPACNQGAESTLAWLSTLQVAAMPLLAGTR